MQVHAVNVEWSAYKERLCAIRQQVFTQEQGVPTELDLDGLDEDAHHFVALNEFGQALGTARLVPTGQIGRMAVLAEQRRFGIGRKLLQAAIDHATRIGMSRVFLHAQSHAEDFYRKSGFLPIGAEFMEAGIPHIEMALELPIAFRESADHRRLPMLKSNAAPEGTASSFMPFTTESGCRDGVVRVLRGARRKVSIVSPALEQSLFGCPDTVDALSEFARRSRQARIEILVADGKAIAEISHPLLELTRRLPSKVSIRRLPDDRTVSRRSFVVVDDTGVWLQPDTDAPTGWCDPHDRVEARRLADEFADLWKRSSDDPELRLLNL